MVLVGLVCGITLFVEVGVVLLIPLAFSIAKKNQYLLAEAGDPAVYRIDGRALCGSSTSGGAVCHQQVGCRCGLGDCVWFDCRAGRFADWWPLFLKLVGKRLPFKPVPAEFSSVQVRNEQDLPSLGATLFTVLLPIILMLVKTAAELYMAKDSALYTFLEFIGNPITAMFIAAFVAYYVLGIRRNMGMGTLLTKTENGFSSIANILLIIGPVVHSTAY
ncbi:DsdX permease [Serratia fonticola]|uniref:DsdX permease n=1 Tax=Serratia fonticola TaxID=47917 RepID=A0A4V6KLQ9_SERFO|nr:DsdX permease [Serratia fonticola]